MASSKTAPEPLAIGVDIGGTGTKLVLLTALEMFCSRVKCQQKNIRRLNHLLMSCIKK
jgi:N-acetylglucosamine kinase-like BadF-type ATPase